MESRRSVVARTELCCSESLVRTRHWIADTRWEATSDQSSGTFTIDAGGTDIWGTSDKFRFIYQQITGDLDIKARVDSITMADAWSKSGVMVRASLAADSAQAFVLVSAGKGSAFQRRTAARRSLDEYRRLVGESPLWVRLVRSGTNVTAYGLLERNDLDDLASDTIALGASAYVGIATTSHNASATTAVEVSHVTLTIERRLAVCRASLQTTPTSASPAVKGSASFQPGTSRSLPAAPTSGIQRTSFTMSTSQ